MNIYIYIYIYVCVCVYTQAKVRNLEFVFQCKISCYARFLKKELYLRNNFDKNYLRN